MISSIIALLGVVMVAAQDALLAPETPFAFEIDEKATYHQSLLVEIDAEQYRQDWNILYLHQATHSHSVVDFEIVIVQKQFPERQGAVISKCRLEDQAKRWCRIDTQGVNFRSYLVKANLDCVSDCKGNITIGFASREWSGNELPIVKGYSLQANSRVAAGAADESQKKLVLFKIIGWMVFTLVLILLAIRFGQKIANIFDRKMQEQRQQGLREKRIPMKSEQPNRNPQNLKKTE